MASKSVRNVALSTAISRFLADFDIPTIYPRSDNDAVLPRTAPSDLLLLLRPRSLRAGPSPNGDGTRALYFSTFQLQKYQG